MEAGPQADSGSLQRGRRFSDHVECHPFVESRQDIRVGCFETNGDLQLSREPLGKLKTPPLDDPGVRFDDHPVEGTQEHSNLRVVFWWDGDRVKEIACVIELDRPWRRWASFGDCGSNLSRDRAWWRGAVECLTPEIAEDAIEWTLCPAQKNRENLGAPAVRFSFLLAQPSVGPVGVDRQLWLAGSWWRKSRDFHHRLLRGRVLVKEVVTVKVGVTPEDLPERAVRHRPLLESALGKHREFSPEGQPNAPSQHFAFELV